MYKDFSNYEIFADSRIWSKKRKKFLKPFTRPDGYQQVDLTDNEGKRHQEKLHKVIYFAVNGLWEYPKGMQLNHIDEVKTNNQISNLELVTPKQNANHGTRTERAAKAMKGKLINRQDQSKRLGAWKNGEIVMVFPSTAEAHRNCFNSGAVSACCRNCYMREGNNVYKGYEWKYLDE